MAMRLDNECLLSVVMKFAIYCPFYEILYSSCAVSCEIIILPTLNESERKLSRVSRRIR